jgi:hypothetical protein
MTDPDFPRLFERLNAEQMQADRDLDRAYTLALIAGLALAALCIAVALTMGVE